MLTSPCGARRPSRRATRGPAPSSPRVAFPIPITATRPFMSRLTCSNVCLLHSQSHGYGEAVQNGLGPGGTSRNVVVDGQDILQPALRAVRIEPDPAACGAGTHGDDDAGLGHCVVQA